MLLLMYVAVKIFFVSRTHTSAVFISYYFFFWHKLPTKTSHSCVKIVGIFFFSFSYHHCNASLADNICMLLSSRLYVWEGKQHKREFFFPFICVCTQWLLCDCLHASGTKLSIFRSTYFLLLLSLLSLWKKLYT